VLILLRDLADPAATALLNVARTLGLDTLVEAHDADELARAARLEAPVIGVNARDLSDFSINRRTQLELVGAAPKDRIVIAESGIDTCAQAAAAELAGANAILVGSTLMRAADPGAKLRDLVSRPLVKVCGLTRQEDVDVAVEAGADMVGFILAAESPRRADGLLDAPDTVLRVAVFVGEAEETDADLVQFYGREDGHRSRDAVLLRQGEQVGSVIDLPWGKRDPSHLERAKAATGRVMLAGGLGPQNVAEAIKAVRPWAVDSARSTEQAPGIKHHDAIRAWVEAIRVEAAR
jgi:indole-3-glycerol phosphate synthase